MQYSHYPVLCCLVLIETMVSSGRKVPCLPWAPWAWFTAPTSVVVKSILRTLIVMGMIACEAWRERSGRHGGSPLQSPL